MCTLTKGTNHTETLREGTGKATGFFSATWFQLPVCSDLSTHSRFGVYSRAKANACWVRSPLCTLQPHHVLPLLVWKQLTFPGWQHSKEPLDVFQSLLFAKAFLAHAALHHTGSTTFLMNSAMNF